MCSVLIEESLFSCYVFMYSRWEIPINVSGISYSLSFNKIELIAFSISCINSQLIYCLETN